MINMPYAICMILAIMMGLLYIFIDILIDEIKEHKYDKYKNRKSK